MHQVPLVNDKTHFKLAFSQDTKRPFLKQTSIRGDKSLNKLIDELKNQNPRQVSIDHDHPLIAVAPAPTAAHATRPATSISVSDQPMND